MHLPVVDHSCNVKWKLASKGLLWFSVVVWESRNRNHSWIGKDRKNYAITFFFAFLKMLPGIKRTRLTWILSQRKYVTHADLLRYVSTWNSGSLLHCCLCARARASRAQSPVTIWNCELGSSRATDYAWQRTLVTI